MTVHAETTSEIIHETEVDFVLRPVSTPIHLVQTDNSLPLIKVNLYNNGRKFVIPDGSTVKLKFLNAKIGIDNVEFEITEWNEDHTAVYFNVTSAMTNLFQQTFGVIAIEKTVQQETQVAHSSPISFTIDRNPYLI